MKIVSWNVNGLRAVHRNGYWGEFLSALSSDIYCLQETKAWSEQIPDEIKQIPGYKSFFNYHKEKKGYAGVALYLKDDMEVKNLIYGTGHEDFDKEGRVIGADFGNWAIINTYFPNGGMSDEAWQRKLAFYDDFLEFAMNLKNSGKSLVLTGDFNVAHEEIDLARPQENEGSVGFRPEEREWFSELLALGFVDVWRELNPDTQKYSWWSMRTRARERNVGWRIDYFLVSEDLFAFVTDAKIHNEIYGSDHCPISLDLNI